MKVKVFDEGHERDLEKSINEFICTHNYDIIDVKFSVAVSVFGEEQVFCFSAMVMYEEK